MCVWILSPSPWQNLPSYPHNPDNVCHLIPITLKKVCHLIPFHSDWVCHLISVTMTRSLILFPLPRQGLSSYPFHPDKACHLIPFTLTRPVTLSLSPRQNLPYYFIPFTLARSAMLSPSSGTLFPSPWPSLLCYLLHRVLYSLHPGKVCYVISFIGYFIPFTLAKSAMLSPSSGTSLCSPPQALSSCPLPSNQICSPIPVSLTRCAVLHVHLATRQSYWKPL